MRRPAVEPAPRRAALVALAACILPLVAASSRPADADILPSFHNAAGLTQLPCEHGLDICNVSTHFERLATTYAAGLNALLATAQCSKLRGWSLQQLVAAVGRRRACTWADARVVGIWTVLPQSCYVLSPECEAGVTGTAAPLFSHALFYFHSLAPAGTQSYEQDASPQLRLAIDRSFGSIASFRAAFAAAASQLVGSGWAWVVALPRAGKLQVLTTSNMDVPLMGGRNDGKSPQRLPILALELGERAYLQGDSTNGSLEEARAAYIDAFLTRINWQGVSSLHRLAITGQYDTADMLLPSIAWKQQPPASMQA
ncbi:hypothetical protein ABPG77_000011 [Micractinium sp. CCAP 211/92]